MKKFRELKVSGYFHQEGILTLKKMFRILKFTAFCLLLTVTQVIASQNTESESGTIAQQKVVSGKVSDSTGAPLPGVTIVVKGTTTGALTDGDGSYSLPNVPANATLQFSFVGMKSQEIVVGNKSKIDVVLEDETIGIEEVVTIGYATRKKGEVTGSVSTVNSESIERSSNKDMAKSLSGKVPGLIVSDRGGYPGSDNTTMLIRGKSTLNNNEPLILIDGIVASTFSFLSPQDIESLTVLKDGAAAIYGARAANGVILITTKRGKQGKTQISLSSSYTLSSFSSTPKLMSSSQYAISKNEIAARKSQALPYTQDQIDKYAAGNDPLNYPNTNWSDLTFANTSPESRTTLSISGGADKATYFVSGDYMDQTGMYASGDLNFKQYQVRSNLDIKLFEDFKLGIDLSGRFGESNQPGVDASYIYKMIYTNEPTQVGIYPNGKVGWGGENGGNPYIMSSSASGFDKKNDNDLRGKFSFDWNLKKITQGLTFKGFAGIRKMSSDEKAWYTPWTTYTYVPGSDTYVPSMGYSQSGNLAILTETFWKYDELMLNGTINYDRTFGDHTVRGFVGYEQTTSNQHTFWASRKDFPGTDHPELFAGSDNGQISYGTSSEWGRVNYFGSLSYDYKKKYFVDLTLRRDGSSNFGPGKQFGTFPGAAVSWSIADESFMSGLKSWLNSLKLRTSWAVMGNDRIGGFQYLTRYNYGGPTDVNQPNYYIFGTTGTRYNGYTSANVPNPNITWETADMKNLGLNFSLLKNRLSGDVNYFFQKRKDILITRNASIPDAAGITLPAENLGKVNNFGWEMELAWKDKVGKVDYNFGFNFTQAKNEVVYMDEAVNVPVYQKREGHPMDSYLVYPTAGIFKDQAQVDATAVKKAGTVEGEPVYLDTNNDGKIDSKDIVRLYSSNIPEIQFGIFGGLSYKGFDLSFMFQGQAKAKMLVFFDQSGSKPEFVFTDRWTADNRNGSYPRSFTQGDPYSGTQNASITQVADFYYRDASYLRLKEAELGYTFSKERIKVGNLKVFVRGANLLTLFSGVYKLGLDPEATGYDNFRLSTYPSLKSYSFGFNFVF